MRLLVVYLFVFLGPLGNLLTPSFLPYQFRTFYLLLPAFFIFYDRIYFKELKTFLLFLPFLLYCFASSYFAELTPVLHHESSPFQRCALFVCESLFMFGAAFYLRNHPLAREKNRLIRLFLYAFFISLIIGYTFFFGFYLNRVSLSTIERFSVITQFGYGILRFSPGSYPNEYGILASFVASVLLLLIAEKKNPHFQIGIHRRWLFPFFTLTFLALILSTTRAAYLSFFLSLIYIFFISSNFRRLFFINSSILTFFVIAFHKHLGFLFDVFILGFVKMSYKLGSFGLRMEHWIEGLEEFKEFHLLGRGYGSLFFIHNVFLEFIFELGVIGFSILLFFLISYFLEHNQRIKQTFLRRWMNSDELFSNRFIVLGLIHIFWFAGSNHNINHHLTWMIFLLFNMNLFARKQPFERALVTANA